MARRTIIGDIYRKVKDPNLVSALSGHKEGSKAFQRYRDIDEEMKRALVKLGQITPFLYPNGINKNSTPFRNEELLL